MMKKGIVVAFPGTGYTCREKLFQQCFEPFAQMHYERIEIDFSKIPFKEIETIEEAFEFAKPEVIRQLEGVALEQYADVVFLATSFGTGLAGWYARQRELTPRFFLLTPTETALEWLEPQLRLTGAVIGTEDHVLDFWRLKDFCAQRRTPCLVFEGVGHKLMAQSDEDTAAINARIVDFMVKQMQLVHTPA